MSLSMTAPQTVDPMQLKLHWRVVRRSLAGYCFKIGPWKKITQKIEGEICENNNWTLKMIEMCVVLFFNDKNI